MAPKRKAAASQTRSARKKPDAAASAAAATAGPPAAAKRVRGKAAPKAAAAPSAAPGKTATARQPGSDRQANSNRGTAAASSAASGPTAASAAGPGGATAGTRKVDELCDTGGVEVVSEYDCMLNQTNIGANNNKFYKLQMLQQIGGGSYLVWMRWGRVGVDGVGKMVGPFADQEAALREFKAKFRSKAGAPWESRASIEPKPGKYVPVEIDHDAAPLPKSGRSPAKVIKFKPSMLDAATQDLVSLILSTDMFNSAMKEFEIDTEKFPLGQLSKVQVAKGHAVLEELKNAVSSGASSDKLAQLTSKFYTIIPHAFGFRRPPVLSSLQAINAKVEMCNVLSDIEIAQGMLAKREESEQEQQEQEHPADENYRLLDADLQLLSDSDPELPVIQQYIAATVGRWQVGLANVWRVTRKGEPERFGQHAKLGNRRLLWHGTKVAVVAAVLKTGLRIMPHSGGRVGKGVYLASELSKSAGYTQCGQQKGKPIGVLFLAEAALGKEHGIVRDNPSLVAPPKGWNSVVARGHREPDPSRDTTIKLDGKPVKVPQGPPVAQPEYANSTFDKSEYLLYSESQVALRYMVTFDFSR